MHGTHLWVPPSAVSIAGELALECVADAPAANCRCRANTVGRRWPAPRTACSCLADASYASSICKQGLVPHFRCACRLRWLTFPHLVGGACLALYQAEQRETLTAA